MESPQLRRIALLAKGEKVDLVAPNGDALAHIIAAAGVHLQPGDQVMGPDGASIDPATSAAELQEGGLYAVTALDVRPVSSAKQGSQVVATSRALHWSLAAFGLMGAIVAFTAPPNGARPLTAVILVLAALLTLLNWCMQSDEATKLASCIAPLLLGACAGALIVPVGIESYGAFTVSMAAATVAILASLVMVTARAQRVRAGIVPVVVIASVVAALGVAAPALSWDPIKLSMVVSGLSALALRALPSLLVKVNEGYHIDYGKFMVLRWTVRGKVPQYLPRVHANEISQLVSNTEARLQTSTVMLSILAGIGIPAAIVPLAGEALIERIASISFVMLLSAGLMLSSRRTVAPELRTPPRIAAAIGLLVFAVLLAWNSGAQWLWIAAASMLILGAVVAVISVSLGRGSRSLGWSRTGDIVDSFAIALVFPAGLVAAGTLELLRGVLA